MSLRVATVATAGTLAHARVLAARLAEHRPGARLHVARAGPAPVDDEPFSVLGLDEIDPSLRPLAATYPWRGVALLVRAAHALHLLRAADGPVVHLDPEVALYAPLDPLLDALEGRPGAVAERLVSDVPDDGWRPSPRDVVGAGRTTPAIFAAGDQEWLAWWLQHLRDALDRLTPSEFALLRTGDRASLSQWLDLAAPRFGLGVPEDPGLAVSAWNLHDRRLARSDGRLLVEGTPLRALVLHGFDPEKPFWLSAAASRARVPDDPVLGEVLEGYAQELLDAGWRRRPAPQVGAGLPNGLTLDRRMVDLFVQAELAGARVGDLGTEDDAERFAQWLEAPARHGGAYGVNRYTEAVWGERDDVRRVFAELDGPEHGPGFQRWLWEWGRKEMSIPDRFLPPPPAGLGVAASADLRPLPAVRVTGFMRGTLGLGAAARLYTEALTAAGVDVTTRTLAPPRPKDVDEVAVTAEVDYAERAGQRDPDVELVCVNADELPVFAEQAGDDWRHGHRTIGVWAWETEDIPERWGPMFSLVDEIWVYTTYIARSLGRVSPVPVVTVPIPVPVPEVDPAALTLDLPDGFKFLFVFDFLSTPARKNPEGLIEAFTRAFAPGEGPQLILKTLHGDMRPAWLDRLRWLARGRDDITFIDVSLPVAERDALMAACDCYVSLHRAEGFGLTPAEAMALGKPVIATAYSGTMDFMTPSNSYLVPWSPAKVGLEGEQYPPEATWAQPDLDAAATFMRRVVDHPDEARTIGERARADVAANLSPEAVGAIIAERLRHLQQRGAL